MRHLFQVPGGRLRPSPTTVVNLLLTNHTIQHNTHRVRERQPLTTTNKPLSATTLLSTAETPQIQQLQQRHTYMHTIHTYIHALQGYVNVCERMKSTMTNRPFFPFIDFSTGRSSTICTCLYHVDTMSANHYCVGNQVNPWGNREITWRYPHIQSNRQHS